MKKSISVFATLILSAMIFLRCDNSGDVHTHEYEKKWSYNSTEHFHKPVCGCNIPPIDVAPHEFTEWIDYSEYKARYCTICYFYESQSHIHSYDWSNPDENCISTGICSECGATSTRTVHSFSESEYSYSDIEHWHKAICSHINVIKDGDADLHSFGEWETNNNGEKLRKCSVCNYTEFDLSSHTHRFSETEYNYDDCYHWHKAICADATYDLKDEDELYLYHNIEWGEMDPLTGDKVGTCVCGYTEINHTYVFSETEYNYNNSSHWHKAICADATEDMKQIGDSCVHIMWGTGEFDSEKGHEKRKCNTCDYNDVSSSHVLSKTEYDSDGSNHWKKVLCKCTNVYSSKEKHDWNAWSAQDPETGNQTRTCKVCGREEMKHEHIYSDVEWVFYSTYYHVRPAICNYDEACNTAVSTISKQSHNKVIGDMDPLTGDANEYCKDCGYVMSTKHTHLYSETEYDYDATDHWKKLICIHGETYSKDTVKKLSSANATNHTYSSWKCIDEQNGTWIRSCTVCGYSQTKHECAYQKGENWTCNDTFHWRARLCQTSNCRGNEEQDSGLHKYDGVEWSDRNPET